MIISGKSLIEETGATERTCKYIAYLYFLLLGQPFGSHWCRGFPAPASHEVFAISHISAYGARRTGKISHYAISNHCHIDDLEITGHLLVAKGVDSFLSITFLKQIYYISYSLKGSE